MVYYEIPGICFGFNIIPAFTGFNAAIYTFIRSGNFYYVAGGFTTYVDPNGVTNNCPFLAKINILTGFLDTTFNHTTGLDNVVNAMVLEGNDLYIAGAFTTCRGSTRQRIAKLNATTGALDTTFDTASGCDNTANALAIDSTGLYVGGTWTNYKGTARQRIVKISKTNASLDGSFTNSGRGWFLGGSIQSLVLDGVGGLYCSGSFTVYDSIAIPSTTVQNICRLNSTTAALDTTFSTTSGANGFISKMIFVPSQNAIYIGGSFTTYKGVTRQNVAKINATTAALDTTFDSASGANNFLNDIVLIGNGLVLLGRFSTYKGATTEYIAKIDTTTAALDTTFSTASAFGTFTANWPLNGYFDPLSNFLYVGGLFSTYKGVSRPFNVRLNPTTAQDQTGAING